MTTPEPRGGEGLKPCPFCASDNLQADFSHFGGSVECLDCGATLPLPTKSPDTQAAARNRRPSAHPARMPTREEVARIIDPIAWRFVDTRGQEAAEMIGLTTDQSLNRADTILALFHTGETKGDGA